jgi:hypothetical protein
MVAPLIISALLRGSVNYLLKVEPQTAHAAVTAKDNGSKHVLQVRGGEIQVSIHPKDPGLQTEDVLEWVRRAADAVTVYYGAFPVKHARVDVVQSPGDGQDIHGTTWGDVDGVQGLSKMRLGGALTRADLDADWTMTHEFIHMALSSLPDESHWLEEGLATYVEPIARAQAGQLTAEKVWEGMVQGMPHGEPQRGDRGLDQTHTWGRTYWGGAMFYLVADVKIRQATQNRKGLQDALRAIRGAGATIDTEWPLKRVLGVGDEATGTKVLSDLYNTWKDSPVSVDLNQLWLELGVRIGPRGVAFDSDAPLASIRRAITARSLR